jgi:hypothetical protein
MDNFEVKPQLLQGAITTAMLCIVMIIKHIISIRMCHSKCKCFGHDLVEFNQDISAVSPVRDRRTPTPATAAAEVTGIDFDSLTIQIPGTPRPRTMKI